MQTATTTAVLIVGAGPTGLTLACELARRDIPFRLVEAADGPQPGSRGKGVQPRSLEVFDNLGIVDRVLAHGRMAMPVRSTAPDGRVVVSGTERPVPRSEVPYTASVITPQWRVEEALRLRLAELGRAVEFGTLLDHIEQSPGSVSAQLSKGGKAERADALWLVGCDGGHSVVRKQARINFAGETREAVRMIVADVELAGLDREAWHTWRHQEGFLALCPLPSTNTFQYQASIAPGQDPELSLANLQAILERRSGRNDVQLHEPEWKSLWRANVRLADRYREGRVFLAGDAAHIHSPAGGQGMNTGIQDAQNLGWKLAAVVHGASPELLDSYESERRPVALSVLGLSDARLKEAMEQKSLPLQRDASTTQLGISYRGSALARDDRDGSTSIRSGDRAPDARGLRIAEGERRLFDLLRGGRFALLKFGSSLAAELSHQDLRMFHVVENLTKPGDLVDREGNLRRAYGAGEQTLVLIRPDGYIGLISDGGEAAEVMRYFTLIEQGRR